MPTLPHASSFVAEASSQTLQAAPALRRTAPHRTAPTIWLSALLVSIRDHREPTPAITGADRFDGGITATGYAQKELFSSTLRGAM
ncbi:hypothetical protein [Pseudomonas sp. CBC3]|uniref:hypothetical protein n=1 Tax=Pseudomonas sp. CBC3 TaxID=3123318 RepID=UPI0030E80185